MIPVSQNSVVSNRKELLRIIIWYYIVQTCITVLHRCVHMYDFIQQTVTEFVCELFVSVPFICDYFKSTVTSSHFLRTAALKKKRSFWKTLFPLNEHLCQSWVGSLPETIILKKGKNCVHEQLFLTLLEQMCSVFSWLEQQELALIITVGWVSTLKKY